MAEELNMEDWLSSDDADNFSLIEDEVDLDELEDIIPDPPGGDKEDKPVDNVEDDTDVDKEDLTPPDQSDKKEIKIDSSSSNTNIYASLGKGLVEGGVFKNVEGIEEIDSYEALNEKFDEEFESRVQAAIKDLTPDEQFYAQKSQLGYSQEEIYNQLQTKKGLDSIDDSVIEDESEQSGTLRKQLITQMYKSKGFSDAKIERDIKRIFDDGDDIEEAKEAYSTIKTTVETNEKLRDTQLKNQQDAQLAARTKSLNELREYSTKTKEIIPGLTLTKKEKDEVFNSLTKPVSTTKDGIPLDSIQDFYVNSSNEEKYMLAWLLKKTNKLKDFSKLSYKKGKSSAQQELENALKISDNGEFTKSESSENLDWLDNAELVTD